MSKDISKVFSSAFTSNIETNVTEKILDDTYTKFYKIDRFPADKINRNHYDSRNGTKIKYLIIHYTVIDFSQTIETFTSNKDKNRVSAHYVISQSEPNMPGGKILSVVPDEKRAWHAGSSKWGGTIHLNSCSIGIEHVNKGFIDNNGDLTWYEFDKDQIISSIKLCKYLIKKYNILPQHVLAHKDIAPGRKEDVGPLFPWEQFYKEGIGAWLDESERTEETIRKKYHVTINYPQSKYDVLDLLKIFGYDIVNSDEAIKSFKAHYSDNQYPKNYNSDITDNLRLWIFGLVGKYII